MAVGPPVLAVVAHATSRGRGALVTPKSPGWQIGLVPDLLSAADPRRGARPGRRVEDGGCGAYLVGFCGNADHSTRVRLP